MKMSKVNYNASRALFVSSSRAVSEVNNALRPLGKKLWRVSETDSYKLIRLLVWSKRHSVSLEYILTAILNVLSKSAERRTGKRSKGLGITVSVLTGDVAYSILKERIAKDFPGGENVTSALEEKQAAMIALLDEEGIGKPRSPLSYSSADDYMKAYAASIKRKKKQREEYEEQIAAMPFRGNPFK